MDVVISENSGRPSFAGEENKAHSGAKALRDSETNITQTFGASALKSSYVVGYGIDGLPAVHKVKPYCPGKTLDCLPFSEVLNNQRSLSSYLRILEYSRTHFVKQLVLPDLVGTLDTSSFWRRFYALFPVRSSNIVKEKVTGKLYLIDAEVDPIHNDFSRVNKLRRRFILWSYFLGNALLEAGLRLYYKVKYSERDTGWSIAHERKLAKKEPS